MTIKYSKMKSIFLVLIVFAFTLFSCENKHKEEHENPHEKEQKHWTYEGETGPEHWVEIEKECECNGNKQSPINIIDIDVIDDSSLKPIDIHYSSQVKIHEITNNGHTIQYNFEEGDYIILNNEKYDLKQIHFHEGSEHTINGMRYPLEMHLVHLSAITELAVLAIMAKEGESSESFTFLEKYLPVENGETKPINAYFDLNLNLPKSKEYCTYSRSLTTPPCTQDVTWFVYKTPIIVSVNQVKQLQESLPVNNYRGEQSINERIVKQYSSH
jgi:carbonic anhydrase